MSPNYLEPCSTTSIVLNESVLGIKGFDSVNTPQEPSTSAADRVPEELKTGLREILPRLDDHAIRQIWISCKNNAPDCAVEEVLHFAWSKSHALERAKNPTGLLIFSVPLACTADAVERLREENRRAIEARGREEQRKARADLEAGEEIRRILERDARGEAALAAMPESERDRLKAELRDRAKRSWPKMPAQAIDQITHTISLKHVLGEPYELPEPPRRGRSP